MCIYQTFALPFLVCEACLFISGPDFIAFHFILSNNNNGTAYSIIVHSFGDKSKIVASSFSTARQTRFQLERGKTSITTRGVPARSDPAQCSKDEAIKASHQRAAAISRLCSPRQPCRRIGSNPHLHRTIAPDCQGPSASSPSNEAHVRPGGWPLQDVQSPACASSYSSNRNVPRLARSCNRSGMVYWIHGTRSSNGLY